MVEFAAIVLVLAGAFSLWYLVHLILLWNSLDFGDRAMVVFLSAVVIYLAYAWIASLV